LKVAKVVEKAIAESLTYKDHNDKLQAVVARKIIRSNWTKDNLIISDA
jgi:hypothetical protein